MVNTADAGRRSYGHERNHGRRNRRKLSSVMAMILGAFVTIEIMIMGAMLLKVDFHSADRIALALGFMVLYSGVVAAFPIISLFSDKFKLLLILLFVPFKSIKRHLV